MNEESIFIIYSRYVVLSKTQRSNVGHARGDQFSRPRANFPRKISKKTSQTTAVSQNNLEIVEMFIESCKREQKKKYGELKNFWTLSLVK